MGKRKKGKGRKGKKGKEIMEKKGEVTRAGGIRGGDRAANFTAVTAAGRSRARGVRALHEGEKMA
jgi:hypothetical protein